MPPKTYNLRNREPCNGDDAHVDVSADTQTVESEPSPLTNAVSFSSTTFEPNMLLSNNLQTNPFGITQLVDTSTHENAIDPAPISTTNALHDNTDTVPPQRRLILPFLCY